MGENKLSSSKTNLLTLQSAPIVIKSLIKKKLSQKGKLCKYFQIKNTSKSGDSNGAIIFDTRCIINHF